MTQVYIVHALLMDFHGLPRYMYSTISKFTVGVQLVRFSTRQHIDIVMRAASIMHVDECTLKYVNKMKEKANVRQQIESDTLLIKSESIQTYFLCFIVL